MAIVEFDPEEFRAAKPQFASMSDQRLAGVFNEACLYVANEEDSLIPYDPPKKMDRKSILFLVVCHLATLEQWAEAGQSGPVASATQGSVSVSYAQAGGPQSMAWWSQTPCGLSAWAYLSRLGLGGFYVPGPKRHHPWG